MKRQRQWTLAVATAIAVMLAAAGASAKTWTGGDGDWFVGANWTPEGVPVNGAAVTINAGTVLLTNETAELASFTMNDGTLTFSNWTTRVRATEVYLQGGTLTHSAQSAVSTNEHGEWVPDARVWITCSNMTVAAGERIQANARGYGMGKGPGAPLSNSGGAHGGDGGVGFTSWINRRGPYGATEAPETPGSGGHSPLTLLSGAGGGVIRIEADGDVHLGGTLTADGGNFGTTHGSGGSGGSIFITCRIFTGSDTGRLSAKGGSASSQGGVGSGGRIAVIYDSSVQAENPGVRFNVIRGAGIREWTAGDGTLFFPDTLLLSEQMGTQWEGGNIHVPGWTHWTVNSLEVAGKFAIPATVTNISITTDMTIAAGGMLTLHSAPTNAVFGPDGKRLDVGGKLTVAGGMVLHSDWTNGASPRIDCAELDVTATGLIDANYRGYFMSHGEGYGRGRTSGAGHGGRGSSGVFPSLTEGNWAARGQIYGDPLFPTQPGSGGGNYFNASGTGGGAIRIHAAGKAIVHGTLSANGMVRLLTHEGSGSGGSILIECQTFHGSSTGLLQVRGGNSSHNGGAAGGGRIAVVYDPVEQAKLAQPNPGVRFDAAPGTGGGYAWRAEAGTLFLPEAATLFLASHMNDQWQNVNLIIPGFTHWLTDALHIDGTFAIPGLERITVTGDMTIAENGQLTLFAHPTNTVDHEIGLVMNVAGTLTVESNAWMVLHSDTDTGGMPSIECGRFDLMAGGGVHADFQGFGMLKGPGAGSSLGGGGYGGAGSRGGGAVGTGGETNGVAHAPLFPGSGGGPVHYQNGGAGGGAIRISATGPMTVNGTIRTRGSSGSTHDSGGAGGAILLSARSFQGNGELVATGGNGNNLGGAGGGGRIAVWCQFLPTAYLREIAAWEQPPSTTEILDHETLWPDLTLSVAAGIGGGNAGEAEPGTIFFGRIPVGTMFRFR